MYAEAYCVANDFDQAQGRVFQAISRIIEASPLLRDSAKVTANKIEFPSTGATITAIATDFQAPPAQTPRSRCSTNCGATQPNAHRGFGTKWFPFRPVRLALG